MAKRVQKDNSKFIEQEPFEAGRIITVSESRKGPTPNGGVASTIFYFDDVGDMADKDEATKAEIAEFDEDGNEVFRTYLDIER